MTRNRELLVALLAVAVGGGAGLLASAQAWDTVRIDRSPPLGPLMFHLTGRAVAPAVIACAVVALAGVIALIATRGLLRRVLGAVLAVTGGGSVLAAVLGARAVHPVHARTLITQSHTGLVVDRAAVITVHVSPLWPVTAVLGGALVAVGGLLVAIRSGRWAALGSRYDAPASRGPRIVPDDDSDRARADLALWQSLEAGDDPTAEERPTTAPASNHVSDAG